MRQRARGYGCDLLERIGAERLHRVEASDGDVGKLPTRVAYDVDVVGNRSGIEHLQHIEWRPGIEHHRFAHVL